MNHYTKSWFDARCDYLLANKGIEDFFITKAAFLGGHDDELQKNGFFED
jgi:hypothetical protein